MKRNSALVIFFIAVLCLAHVLSLHTAANLRKKLPQGEGASYVMSPDFLKITALEFDGVASDFMFLRALVFMGSTIERSEYPRVKQWEWTWMYNVLRASAGLDKRFRDPYYFANANLTWGGHMVEEVNDLLEQGVRARPWDSLLPFYLGFNSFYFLHDDVKASEFLMEASKRPDASPIYASLAAKLAYKEKRTETAISFLEFMVQKEEDPLFKKEYEERIEIMKTILFLQEKVSVFEKTFRKKPKSLKDLAEKKIIEKLPLDPYGGSYYLDEAGEVKSSIEEHLLPYRKKPGQKRASFFFGNQP